MLSRSRVDPVACPSLGDQCEVRVRGRVCATQVMMTVLRVGGNDMCQRATDVLLSVVQHDAGPLRDYFTEHAERDDFRVLLK